MSPPRQSPISRSLFLVGFTSQQEWAWLITTAFFFGKIGGALFLLSWLSGYELGAVVALLIVGVGKTTAHLLFLGKPLRFWRAGLRWRTSWISRGIIAMTAFLLFGFVYVLPYLGLDVPGWLADACGVLAALAALVVMVYDGFVLRASRGIPFWQSNLVPLLVFGYALLGGITVLLVLRVVSDAAPTAVELEWVQLGLLVLNLALIWAYVANARMRQTAAAFAAQLLTRGPRGWLFGVGVGVGLLATLVLASISVATGSEAVLAAAAVTDLLGHYLLFFGLLTAGVYAPPRPLPAVSGRPGFAR